MQRIGGTENQAREPLQYSGLDSTEAAARLARDGYNELPRAGRRTPLRIIAEVLREPMLALLLASGIIYLVLGDIGDATILLVFASLSIVITVAQESRTERVLETLRDLTSPRAFVIRDGERKRIAGRELVRGDIVILGEGDRVPADVRLVEAHQLQTDESLLTGESVPVRKLAAATLPAAPVRAGGDDLPVAFAGSLIVRGQGIGEVIATGVGSEIGKIGKSLASLTTETPHLQRQMQRLVRGFAVAGLCISLLVVLLYATRRGDWLDAVLAGIAVGMSMLPEEFPVVLAVTLAMGAWRISQARVLTRRATAIESLGATTVLCTDKTGTLTENRMRVAALQPWHGGLHRVDAESLPHPLHRLAQTGMLASAREPFDPMEKALHQLAAAQAPLAAGHTLVHTYALSPQLLAMSQAWRSGDDDVLTIAAKGAPEAIATLCRLDASERQRLQADTDAMAADGLRVLGLACAHSTALPATQQELHFELLGLVGLADPLRTSVPAAVAECRRAGIRVVMITGDYPATAGAIARAAGLAAEDVVTGSELAALDDAALTQRVRATTVFARIMPEQKLRIVNALKADGEVVAMTGDGVNDAPSLKAAHIGVAMGGRGTDVAREAAALVLLDDDFGSIVATVQLGRRIYDNLRKATNFILAVHVPIAGLALLPLFTGLPLLLGPMHIAFLEMVIDPVCSLVFEAETGEPDLMQRKPRDPQAPLLTAAMAGWALLQGLLALALVTGFYLIALQRGMPTDEVRALCFQCLVLCIIVLIFVNRSASASLTQTFLRPNTALVLVLAGVAVMLGLTQWWTFARDLFHFGPLHADDLARVLGAALSLLLALETLKAMMGRFHRSSTSVSFM